MNTSKRYTISLFRISGSKICLSVYDNSSNYLVSEYNYKNIHTALQALDTTQGKYWANYQMSDDTIQYISSLLDTLNTALTKSF